MPGFVIHRRFHGSWFPFFLWVLKGNSPFWVPRVKAHPHGDGPLFHQHRATLYHNHKTRGWDHQGKEEHDQHKESSPWIMSLVFLSTLHTSRAPEPELELELEPHPPSPPPKRKRTKKRSAPELVSDFAGVHSIVRSLGPELQGMCQRDFGPCRLLPWSWWFQPEQAPLKKTHTHKYGPLVQTLCRFFVFLGFPIQPAANMALSLARTTVILF